MSKIEYSDLLFEISEKLDVNKLPRMLFMCRGEILKGSERNIRDVLTLFEELERNNSLEIDRLDTLKELLTQMKKPSLLKKVREFEIRRKAHSVGIVSSLKRAATCIKGAIKLVCNLRTIAGGLLVVTSGMALRSCSNLDEFVEAFNKVVLVSYSKLVEISEGSLCFTVQAETPLALKELWDMYKSGTLQNRLQEFLVTDEIKQLARGEDVEVTVYIDEQEYKAAYLDLILLEEEESHATEEERLRARGRSRRNSDSVLCFKQNEDDLTLMKLEHAENKLSFEWQKRQFLEEENKKLRMEIAVINVQRRLFWQQEETAQKTEGLERPSERRRRNSDSSLYCEARDETTAQSERGAETRHLDSEKYELVQSYVQNIQETYSITTETTDSRIRTHGEPSDLEIQDISDHSFQLCLKDLDTDVIREMRERLLGDQVAASHIYKSFGIKGPFRQSMNIFELFPDTPVKLFKDVLEVLQLYDLVELLEKSKKAQPVRSLRPGLPLQEIEKLRKTTDPRPTTYHSNVAVLIITDVKDHHTEGIERFFKGLSSKSDVTVFEWKRRAYDELLSVFRLSGWDETKARRMEQEMQLEMKSNKKAVSAVIKRWIQNQGNYSMFAVFVTVAPMPYELTDFIDKPINRLMSEIPNKIKFFMSRTSVSMPEASESLVVTVSLFEHVILEHLLVILDKRWQTLDLISMMEELKRCGNEACSRTRQRPFPKDYKTVAVLTDRLSSRPRFKKEEDLTDSA